MGPSVSTTFWTSSPSSAALDFRHEQQIVDQAGHPVDLPIDIRKEILVDLFGHLLLIEYGFRQNLHRGERRFKLVRCVAHKFTALLIHILQPGRHRVKRLAQLCDFILALYLNALFKIPYRDGHRAFPQLLQRAREMAGEKIRDDSNGQHCDPIDDRIVLLNRVDIRDDILRTLGKHRNPNDLGVFHNGRGVVSRPKIRPVCSYFMEAIGSIPLSAQYFNDLRQLYAHAIQPRIAVDLDNAVAIQQQNAPGNILPLLKRLLIERLSIQRGKFPRHADGKIADVLQIGAGSAFEQIVFNNIGSNHRNQGKRHQNDDDINYNKPPANGGEKFIYQKNSITFPQLCSLLPLAMPTLIIMR